MINYEIIETKKKFKSSEIACIYDLRGFFREKIYEPEVNLICDRPICKDVFLKFYLIESNVKGNNKILNIFKEKERVVVLLKEELDKIYTNGDDGYILSDDFEHNIYECDFNLELDRKIKEIGTKIIRKTFFGYSDYSRSIRLVDNKMIIRSSCLCLINLLNKEDVNLEYCDELNIEDIQEIVCSLIVENKVDLVLDEISNDVKEFLLMIEKEYGKINNIYEVKKGYIGEINDMFSARTLIILTDKVNIAINTGFID